MLKRLVTFAITCTLFSQTGISQTLTGDAAKKALPRSKLVRLSKYDSTKPDFVQFEEAAQFPSSQFANWVKKELKIGEGLELNLFKQETDKLGFQHNRYRVTKNGIEVFGAFVFAHTINNAVASYNGRIPVSIATKTATLNETEALQAAKNHVGAETYKWELPSEENHLKWETGDSNATYFPTGQLVYIDPTFEFSNPEDFRLAFKFDIYAHKPVSRAEVFVDAQTGIVLFENHRIHIADAIGTAQTGYSGQQNIVSDNFNGTYRLRENGRGGGINTFNMNQGTDYGNSQDFTDSDNFWNNVNANLDQYATDAHWGAEMTYDYFLNEHGRQSIDDNNMPVNSYIHFDQNYFNAFWDGQRMTYGDGNGNPLTSLDICGHEMTHGVTENSAALIYQDEFGALNESFSDIFGAAVEFTANPSSGDWLMGEDIGTLRSMSNPNQFGDPDTYEGDNWFTGASDNGGVHVNSGVQNKWFYILTEGETGTNDNGNNYSVTGIGLADAQAIAYRNLTVYLGPTSQFEDARFYAIQSAIDLFGGCSPQVIACTNAWYAVGLGEAFNPIVEANFSADITVACEAPFTVNFNNESNNGSLFVWNFGDGETSTDLDPSHTYSSFGDYTVTLFVDGEDCGTDEDSIINFVSINANNPCSALMPSSGSQTLAWCTGTLYDSGGPNENYSDNTDVTTTISPIGATSVTLDFTSFGYEETYDYMFVYDGPTTGSPLIGQYDGFNLPQGGTITSTGGSITIRQTSDEFLSESGFSLNWECQQPSFPPTPNFTGGPRNSCNGLVTFSDLSINNATNWLWNFGDGNTSINQNPTHTYAEDGTYNVTLTAGNSFGTNTVTLNEYITVERPEGPIAFGGSRCSPGSLELSAMGNGTLQWYSQENEGVVLGTGSNFSTPVIAFDSTFYVEDIVLPATYNVGPADNTFGGGDNFQGDQFLMFDCFQQFTINTVKVYAQETGNRTIELRNENGLVLQSTTINIADGEQVITLDFTILPGTNYQLGTTPDPDLFRNNDSPSYPYLVQDVLSITNSSAGLDFYYFFYDWQISTPGCISQRTPVEAIVHPQPIAEIDFDGSNLVSTNAAAYQWFLDEQPILGADLITYSPIVNGNYSVEITDENGCISTSETYNFITVGIERIDFEAKIYPNPFGNHFVVETDNKLQRLILFDVLGAKILDLKPDAPRTTIETTDLAYGIYFLEIHTENGKAMKKLVKSQD